jgi:hypothetical protein
MMKRFGFTKASLTFYVAGFLAMLLGTGILSVTVGFKWLAFAGVYSVAAGWVLFTIAVFKEMRLTKSPTDSVKELLDNIVKGYSNGPYTVINLEYNSYPMRDAVCKRLTRELFEGIFKEAAEEVGGTLGKFTFADKPIDCEPGRTDGEANAGIRNIQVTPK